MRRRNWVLFPVAVLVLAMMVGACKGRETGAGSAVARTADSFDPSKLKIVVALGWMANESGWVQRSGYTSALLEAGVLESNITYFDANYDPVLQSQQLESVIEAKPDFIFMTPASGDGLSEAVRHVVEAGIGIAFSDGSSAECEDVVTTETICDNYRDGAVTMEWLAKQLDYKGTVCLIKLDPNPAWKPRSDAAKDVVAKYPDMRIVAEWSWDPTGVNTPRQAMDGFLAANPARGSISAVWAAWDTACIEAIEACRATGRTEIIFAGHDGGQEGVDAILEPNAQLVVSMGPNPASQCYNNVKNAMAWLKGETIQRRNYAETTILEPVSLKKAQALLKSGQALGDYGNPGQAVEWGLPQAPAGVTAQNVKDLKL
jgi:ABC-type sugar transport system substrate-binding protein